MKVSTIGILSLISVAISSPLWAGPVGAQKSLSPDQAAVAVTELQAKKEQVSRQMIAPPYNKGPILIHNMDRVS
jgi:outer membrane murein-binding lipoprotein Lpp